MMKAFPLHLCVILFGCGLGFGIQVSFPLILEAFVSSQKNTDLVTCLEY